jgi:hypothetical protein
MSVYIYVKSKVGIYVEIECVLLCLNKRIPAYPYQKPNAERHYLLGSVHRPNSQISTLKTIYVAYSRP